MTRYTLHIVSFLQLTPDLENLQNSLDEQISELLQKMLNMSAESGVTKEWISDLVKDMVLETGGQQLKNTKEELLQLVSNIHSFHLNFTCSYLQAARLLRLICTCISPCQIKESCWSINAVDGYHPEVVYTCIYTTIYIGI